MEDHQPTPSWDYNLKAKPKIKVDMLTRED
jgi:hypothetical protein